MAIARYVIISIIVALTLARGLPVRSRAGGGNGLQQPRQIDIAAPPAAPDGRQGNLGVVHALTLGSVF